MTVLLEYSTTLLGSSSKSTLRFYMHEYVYTYCADLQLNGVLDLYTAWTLLSVTSVLRTYVYMAGACISYLTNFQIIV